MTCVPWSMAPLGQAATLLNLGVAKGPTRAVVTAQSHTPLRGLQLLATFTCVLHLVGLQGVPVGRSAQHPALLGAACACHRLCVQLVCCQAPEVLVTKTLLLLAHLPIALGQMFLLQLSLPTRCPKSTAGCPSGPR